jgi:putative ABC transport system permease protein
VRFDIKAAVKALLACPTFTFSVISVLALGIGASTLMFSVLYAVLLRPLAYPEAERVYEISGQTPSGASTQILPAVFQVMRERVHTLASATLMRTRAFIILDKNGAESSFGQALAGDGLRLFGVSPMVGHWFAPGATNEVVLSHGLWLRHYHGDTQLVGRAVSLNDESYTVAGIMPPSFETTNRALELWVPWNFTARELAEHNGGGFPMLARRRSSATEPQLQAEIDVIERAAGFEHISGPKGWRVALTQLQRQRVSQYRRMLWVLFGAVGLVLLTACFNVAGLTIARSVDRRQETALRLALGAPGWRVFRQLMIESLILAMTG